MNEKEAKKNNNPSKILSMKRSSDNNLNTLTYRINLFQVNMVNPSSMLDIGSQEGQFANMVYETIGVKDISCIDLASTVVESGEKRFPTFKWYSGDVITFDFPEKYDMVTWLNGCFSFEKEERKLVMERISSYLNDNGYLLISYGDVNFEVRGMSLEDVIDEIKDFFDVINVIKEFEYYPMLCDTDFKGHKTFGRWYTSILCRVKE